MTRMENVDGQLDDKQQEFTELQHDLDVLRGKVWRLQRKESEQLVSVHFLWQSHRYKYLLGQDKFTGRKLKRC